jgi:hypothetical protein
MDSPEVEPLCKAENPMVEMRTSSCYDLAHPDFLSLTNTQLHCKLRMLCSGYLGSLPRLNTLSHRCMLHEALSGTEKFSLQCNALTHVSLLAGSGWHWQAAQGAEDALKVGHLDGAPGVNALSGRAGWGDGPPRPGNFSTLGPADSQNTPLCVYRKHPYVLCSGSQQRVRVKEPQTCKPKSRSSCL